MADYNYKRLGSFIEKYFDELGANSGRNKIGLDLLGDVLRFYLKRGDLDYLYCADDSMLNMYFSQMLRNFNGYSNSPVYLFGTFHDGNVSNLHEYLLELAIYIGAVYNLDYRKHSAMVYAPKYKNKLYNKTDVEKYYGILRNKLLYEGVSPDEPVILAFATVNSSAGNTCTDEDIILIDYVYALMSDKFVLRELHRKSSNSIGKLGFDEDLNAAYYRKLVKKDGNQYYSSKNIPFYVTSLVDIFVNIRDFALHHDGSSVSVKLESVSYGEGYVMVFNAPEEYRGRGLAFYCATCLTAYCGVVLRERGGVEYIKIDLRSIN